MIRNYTVSYAIDNPFAKWPKAFGSAVFLDSKYLLENMIEMLYSNTINMLTRNNYKVNILLQVDNIYMFVKDWIMKGQVDEAEYAMQVHLLVKDRMKKYMDDY